MTGAEVTVHLILLLSLITITMTMILVTLEGPGCPVAFPVGWMGDSVEDTVGSGEKTADLGRVVTIVIMIRMTWEAWWILQRTGGWLQGGTWHRNTGWQAEESEEGFEGKESEKNPLGIDSKHLTWGK